MLTTSMPLEGFANEDAYTRQNKPPANNFYLFGLNLGNTVRAAKKSLSGFGNLFSGNRGYSRQNNQHEPIDPYGNGRNTNTISPIGFPSRTGIQNTRPQGDVQGERYVWQEYKSEDLSTTVPDRKQVTNAITVPERYYEGPENTGDNPENGEIDQQLVDSIFQKSQFPYDSTSVDYNVDGVTETSEYETVSILH